MLSNPVLVSAVPEPCSSDVLHVDEGLGFDRHVLFHTVKEVH